MRPLHELGAAEAVALLRDGTITSEQLVAACLDRIAAEDGRIGAFEHLDPGAALAQARRVDATSPKPPLAGLPVALKDIIDTADLPTECGFTGYRGRRPERDAACATRLRAAGAVILGKTVTTEFAFFQPGKTRNPHDPARTPGGSSSGSAAAVAAHMVPAALGTQTAGSIIRPASFCGVVGFKPTYGLLSLDGVAPFAPSLDTLGILVRRVADVRVVLDVLTPTPQPPQGAPSAAGSDLASPPAAAGLEGVFQRALSAAAGGERASRPPRVAVCRTEQWKLAKPSSQRAVDEAAMRVALAGAPVAELDLGPAFQGLADAQRTLMAAGAARTFRSIVAQHGDAVSAVLRDLVRDGEGLAPDREDAARLQRDRCRELLHDVFVRFDVLLTPSAIGEAPLGLESTGDPAFNRIWTLLGTPCVSLPGARGPAGMPVGVQLVGAVGRDAELLASAEWVERALGG